MIPNLIHIFFTQNFIPHTCGITVTVRKYWDGDAKKGQFKIRAWILLHTFVLRREDLTLVLSSTSLQAPQLRKGSESEGKVSRSRLPFVAGATLPSASQEWPLFLQKSSQKGTSDTTYMSIWDCRNSSRGDSPEALQGKPLSILLFRYSGSGDRVIHSKLTCYFGGSGMDLVAVVETWGSLLAS